MSADPTQPVPDWWQQAQPPQGPPPPVATPRRLRGRRRALIAVIVIIVVLVVGDRAANAYTENQMASQFQSSLDLSGKPNVNIQGIPVPDPAGRP